MKQLLMWVLLLLSLFFAWWSYESLEYESKEQNLTHSMQEKIGINYLDEHILTAIEKENFDDVLMYQNLAGLLGRELLSSTLAQIEAHNGFLEKSWRNTKAFTSGFVDGKADSAVGMSGSIASDLTLYGDLRDLNTEGTKYMNDEPYDAFILNISLVGIGLSASQLLSAGVSTPLKVGASVLKLAKKSGKLTKPFTKELSTRLAKTVDTKMLKNLDIKTIEKSINIKPVQALFMDINKIKTHTSLVDTIGLMKYVDTPKALKSIGKISSKYKANTKGVMRVLGKQALRAGKSVMKFTTKFIWTIIGFFASIFGFLFMVILKGNLKVS